MGLRNPLLQSIFVNFVFLVLCLGIGGLHYGSLDDFFMSSVVTGAYGRSFDAHTLFVNGVYPYFLKPFYFVLPGVGWYSVFEFLSVFVSFTVLVYCLLKQLEGRFGLIASVFLLACLTPEFYLQIGFTQCSAALSAAGILLLYFGCRDKKMLVFVLGVIFLLAGIVFRKEGFLLGVPFLAMITALLICQKRKIPWLMLAAFIICVAGYLGLQTFNRGLFQDEEYSYYMNYQWPRATLGDGEYFDQDVVYDELEEREMSGQDFRLLRSWTFYDTEVFGLDSLRPIVDVIQRNRYELNHARMPGSLLLAMGNSFLKTNAWCWGALCLMIFFCNPKRAGWYAWGSLSLIAVCLAYLLLQNRVVHHVEMGIWLYASFCAIPFFEENRECRRTVPKQFYTLVSIAALGCFILGLMTQRHVDNDRCFFGVPTMPVEWSEFIQYSENHPGDVFLLGFEQYKSLAIYKDPIYRSAAPGSWGNIIPMGYWNINLPGMKREMESRGVQNPLRDIVQKNVYVVDDGNNFQLENFYERHYHQKIAADTLCHFGNMGLLKYHLENGDNQ